MCEMQLWTKIMTQLFFFSKVCTGVFYHFGPFHIALRSSFVKQGIIISFVNSVLLYSVLTEVVFIADTRDTYLGKEASCRSPGCMICISDFSLCHDFLIPFFKQT